ncbi:hypothetical protein XU18_2779 [Perkinsela sp. CCAP 1560/4]|nr:hypothetical protein XU18_2779 [Perkinsela sp. CCAP 1560/4]|eukprot:KNH06274.1 hypothetical protein XU18_2779 [Perkinsela sp. CCAP 1560/4]
MTEDFVSMANAMTVEKLQSLPSDFHRHVVLAYCHTPFRQSLPGIVPLDSMNINKRSVKLKLGDIGVMALANREIKAGETVYSFCGPMTDKANIFTVAVDHDRHMIPTGGGIEFLAHSCQPTVKLVIEKHEDAKPSAPSPPFDAAASLPDLMENMEVPEWWHHPQGEDVDAEGDQPPFKFQNEYTMHVVAVRDISVGEVLCFNYLTSEYIMDQKFDCLCGKISSEKENPENLPQCFGRIQGFKFLAPELKDALRPFCTDVVIEAEAADARN